MQWSQPLSTSNIMKLPNVILTDMKRNSVVPYSPEKFLLKLLFSWFCNKAILSSKRERVFTSTLEETP